MKNVLFLTGSGIVLAVCGAISLFLVASGYESLYNRSLPLVHTIDEVNLSAFEESYDLNQAVVKDDNSYGNYGQPLTLKFPERSARLDIVQPLRGQDGAWLARANTLHILSPEKPRSGSMGVAFIYCRAGFRTITTETAPAVGSNVFMDTDHSWRYVYKITSVSVAPASRTYVMADGGGAAKLLIGCYDSTSDTNIYIEATLLSVQGMDA